ncbi:DUF418 domain-containing protein [uncultured Tenacibaculum sp.]|uniref:DUF418 domain-containing protein n=1 Tax=uncultured Tenacibaculum sp. TaxID=174713 RepID=UPI00261174A5|nr:DUF418 domain-containing protein [uncultured Tenacibaculum sp.]
MKKRIVGIDVARALAVIGMIIVNFKVVFGQANPNWISTFASFFDGKAAATFVVLAGVGLALMTNSSIKNKNQDKLKKIRNRIIKRAMFLFLIGISYIAIWPADILHFYGVYMIFTVLLLTNNLRSILIVATILILTFPILLLFLNYEAGWDFSNLVYKDFWTIKGFVRNLFFNGFHPVIPWTSFMLFGYWLGRQDLNNNSLVKKICWISTIVFITIQVLSYATISILSEGNEKTVQDLTEVLGTNPMPPLPLYMFNGISVAFMIITICILVSRKWENSIIIEALNKTGQLALTFYVAHVIIGMGIVEVFGADKLGTYTITFSLIYALGFSLCCVFFAVVWRRYFSAGPLEWILRKITD